MAYFFLNIIELEMVTVLIGGGEQRWTYIYNVTEQNLKSFVCQYCRNIKSRANSTLISALHDNIAQF